MSDLQVEETGQGKTGGKAKKRPPPSPYPSRRVPSWPVLRSRRPLALFSRHLWEEPACARRQGRKKRPVLEAVQLFGLGCFQTVPLGPSSVLWGAPSSPLPLAAVCRSCWLDISLALPSLWMCPFTRNVLPWARRGAAKAAWSLPSKRGARSFLFGSPSSLCPPCHGGGCWAQLSLLRRLVPQAIRLLAVRAWLMGCKMRKGVLV